MSLTTQPQTTADPKKFKGEKTGKLIRRIAGSYLSEYKGLLAFAVLTMAVAASMTGALAKLMEPMIDDVFQAKNADSLYFVAVSIFIAFMVRGFSTYGHTVLMNKIGQGIVAKIQNQLYGHLLNLDMQFFHENPSGQLISRVVNDVTLMRTAVAECLTGIGKSLLTLIILCGVMFYQDWKLALAAFFVFPVSAIMLSKIGKKLRNVSNTTQVHLAEFSDRLNQSFQGVRMVKAYGIEDKEREEAEAFVLKIFKLVQKAVRVSALTTPITEMMTGAALFTVVVYGGSQVITGNNTTGAFFSFITALMLAYEPMKRLAKLNTTLQIGLSAADRVFQIMDMKPLIQDKPGAKTLETKEPDIQFKNVSYRYPQTEKFAVEDISFTVPSGKTVALVGASGSGKSTLLNLIPRFYEVHGGGVFVGGEDIRDITMKSLREHIALVSQEVAIFNNTIEENIRFGNRNATSEDIQEAARKAAAHDFIMALPAGYSTIVGEHGIKLSGGQRQRIAIARAMLRDAPILLLDEATSALDTESERLVQKALGVLQKGRTTLVVAHRLSTIVNADMICVLDQGHIVETGTHDDLLALNGYYARYYGLQLSENAA